MAYTAVGMQRFGGLRLDVDPLEAGPETCIDGMDFDLDDDGRVRPRAGWRRIVHSTSNPGYPSAIYQAPNSEQIMVVPDGTGATSVVYDYTGRALGWWTGGGPWASFAEVLVGGGRHVLAFMDAGVLLWNPTTGSVVAWTDQAVVDGAAGRTMPLGYAAGVTPWGADRLVLAHATAPGSAGTWDVDRVWFSEPGQPNHWSSNNYVRIEPGRGGEITGIAVWRELLFVFKRDRFAVFYGESQLADGSPVFQYRMVNRGLGAENPRAVAVAPEGVYFVSGDGRVALTTGAEVKVVSDAVAPLLEGIGTIAPLTGAESAPPWWTGWKARVAYAREAASLAYADGRLYVSLVGRFAGAGDRYVMLAYDPARDAWMPWTARVRRLVAAPGAYAGAEHLAGVLEDRAGSWHIGTFNRKKTERTTDLDGAVVSAAHWQSGMYALSEGAPQVNVRQSALWGRGLVADQAVDLAVASDDAGFDRGELLVLPTGSLPGRELQSRSRRARYFAHRIRGARPGGRWSVHALEHEIDSVRPVGVGR